MERSTERIIRVNLTQKTIMVESIDSTLMKQFIGGRGLGTKILYDEVDPKVDPLSPDNKLIFMAGPLTGSGAPCGSRYMVITKSPLTSAIACSNSGGHFPAELRSAGYLGIIVEGKAPTPVYLLIDDDTVHLRDATLLWKKTTHQTEDALRADIADAALARDVRIASIGPAGENLSRIACVINDKHRAAGRSGVGAVMGSKNLKAIAVRGTKKIAKHNNDTFTAAVRAATERLKAGPVTSQGLPKFGTAILVNIINECGILPTRNFQQSVFAGASKISGETLAETYLVRNKACYACPIACGRLTKVTSPETFKGEGEGPEYETVELLGAGCGIDDLAAITKANYLCNEFGLDTISAAGTVATAMELYEKGYLPYKDIGMDLRFGNAEALLSMIYDMAYRRGLGAVAADGGYVLAQTYGHPELFMGVKRQELPAYDPRGAQGMGLTYATSNRGACHVRGYLIANEILGVHEKLDPLTTQGKASAVKAIQELTAVFDASGLCLFASLAPGMGYDVVRDMLNGLTGFGYTSEDLRCCGERIWNIERLFNLKAGFTAADDTLPKRLLEEPLTQGGPKGMVCMLDKMLPEYYSLRGWDTQGVPSKEKLAELGLL
ncbi:MAG: aldehyde ferredoxin oxidoreductase family protein [Desulfobacterota bacterium]|nr:aldehyde ferredoxin oxidoreductase family protein [Thermodesulfobacteriota bacterium]